MMESADRLDDVVIFIGRLKAVHDERVDSGILAVAELGALPGDAGLADVGLLGHEIAEGHTVVEGSYLKRELDPGFALEIHHERVVVVADVLCLTHGYGVTFVDAAQGGAHLEHRGAQRSRSLQVQAKLRFIDEALAPEVDGVAKGRLRGGPGRKREYDLSIGRGQLQWVLGGVLGTREESGCGNT